MMHDPIALQRYEYKYIISPALVEPVRSFISPYCDIDPYADREDEKFYTVHSLYLDTRDYTTYLDKVDEVPDRFKLRIRAYGKKPDGQVKFEVKRRLDEVFLKTSVVVPDGLWPRLLARPGERIPLELTESEKSAFDGFMYRVRTLEARPKMLVKYQRQAYRSRIDKYVRVSFDRRLQFETRRSYDLRTGRTTQSAGEIMILELKFARTAPFWLVDLVRRFELARTGFSKYCWAISESVGGRFSAGAAAAGRWGKGYDD